MQISGLSHLPIKGPVTATPMTSGTANHVFHLQHESGEYVLKRFQFGQRFGLDRRQEVALQRQLADLDLAPEILHFDYERGLVLMPYYADGDLTTAQLDDNQRLRELAEVLARIHRVSVEMSPWSLKSRCSDYCEQLAEFDKKLAKQHRKTLQRFATLLNQACLHPVFCHHDVSFNHVLLAQPRRVIDWEYSGYGDRCFDLASATTINNLSDQQSKSLINAYDGVSGELVDPVRVADWQAFSVWLNQLWFALHRYLTKGEGNDEQGEATE
ncbi:hypothetical protein CWI84_08650 [Idiomarina tyrosinivorans]|uniref:Aminoglycoside phosphotransferase domain-containing protein n=1 Tax=Idiomarina tyrosinivorans TaxID=1445662 RepID=A0A432ZQA7_9GAMM|nr:choline kinase family protein [Idiomarina tyrosinivorans]RUO80018.1 hypothetical protein CWI84_08650 [Idiomarina tyrosinivorans]